LVYEKGGTNDMLTWGYEEQGGDHYLFPFIATTKPLSLALW